MTAAARREFVLPLLAALAAAGTGAVYAVSAWLVDPFVLPALAIGLTLAIVTLSRPEVGLAVGVALLPLGNLGLTGQPRWAAAAAWATFLFGLAVTRREQASHRVPPIGLAVGAMFLSALLSYGVAGGAGEAIPVVRFTLTGLMLFYAITVLTRDRWALRWVIAGTAFAGFAVGAFAMFQWVTGSQTEAGFFTGSGALVARADAGFGQPNQLGGFLLILVPFLLAGAALMRRTRAFYLSASAFAVAGVYLSFSRTALVALALVPFFFLRVRTALVLAPLLVVLLVSFSPALVRERFATLNASGSETATRADFWRTGLTIWQDAPVLGVGAGGYPSAYSDARVPNKQFLPDSLFEPPPHAHNLLIHQLSEQGLLGLLALLGALGAAARAALELRRHAEKWARVLGSAGLAFLAAFLLHNQFDVTLLEATGSFFFALLGVLSAGVLVSRQEEADGTVVDA